MTSLSLAYGHVASNLGDLAINEGFHQLCRDAGIHPPQLILTRKARPKYLSRMKQQLPEAVLKESWPPSLNENSEERIRELLALARAVIDPGAWARETGLARTDVVVANAGEHLFESSTGENAIDLIWRVLPLLAASTMGKPAIQLPATIGPFLSDRGNLMLDTILETASAWAVRDVSSRQYLSRSRRIAPIVTHLDPAFFLPPIKRQRAENPVLAIIPRLEGFGMRVGTKSSKYFNSRARQSGYQGSLAYRWAVAVGEHYLLRGWDVDLFVQTEADRSLVEAIAKQLRTRAGDRAITIRTPGSVTEYRQWIGRSHALVSSRFHACILGLSVGVPSVGVYHEAHWLKMPGLYSLLGQPGQAVALAEEGDDRFVSVLRALARADSKQGAFERTIAEQKKEAIAWFQNAVRQDAAPRSHATLRQRLLVSISELLQHEQELLEASWNERSSALLQKVEDAVSALESKPMSD